MRHVHPKVLLVEGDEDKRVIPYLMEANGVRWGERNEPKAVHIESYDGVEQMLQPGEIETHLKASGLQALGILTDADDNARRRWERVRSRCISRFPALPVKVPEGGLVAASEDGLRLGVWLMPDNRSRGMLETFLSFLRPADNEHLLQFAEEACSHAKALGAPCRDAHADKAQIHTWLAWQDPPGRQLHQAIIERILDPGSPHAEHFVRWFKRLYDV